MVEQHSTREAAAAIPAAPSHLLITISTPTSSQPIARLGSKQELLGGSTIRNVVERSISLRSPASQGVPIEQLESEMTTVLAIGELLASGTAEVVAKDSEGAAERLVRLDDPAQRVAQEHIDEQGGVFWTLTLEVRAISDMPYAPSDERRQVQVTTPAPELAPTNGGAPPILVDLPPPPVAVAADAGKQEAAAEPAPTPLKPAVVIFNAPEEAPAVRIAEPPAPAAEPAPAPAPVAKVQPEQARPLSRGAEAAEAAGEQKGYVRKTDTLRAQFLPEIEALDLSGLFVGDFGVEIRQEVNTRNVVLADPSRITDTLLKGNGFRRAGDHMKALGCYQELVDMDPSNADFRFLCGMMLRALGRDEEALEAFTRARELGHDGAQKEIEELRKSTPEANRKILGFLKFWKQ